MRILWIFVLYLCVMQPLYASFDRQYEYRSYIQNESEVLEYFDKIDAEYTSDILTYSLSPQGEVAFQTTDKGFFTSFGSLSRSEFMKDMRLKIKHSVSDKIDFKLNYIEHKDFETHQVHSVIELVWKVADKLHLSSFADLDFEKVNDNVGFSATYLPSGNHEIKFFYNMVQFDRNKRNRSNDQFEKAPYTYGIVGRYFKSKNNSVEYFEYGFINETELLWIFPSEDERLKYQRWMATLRYLNPTTSESSYGLFYQADNRRDSKEIASTSSLLESLDLTRHQLQFNYLKRNFHRTDLESGVYFVYRDAKTSNGPREFYDLIPYITFHFNKVEDSAGYWSLGYDVDFHYARRARFEHIRGFHNNHRGNILWTARLNDSSYLRFAATLDIDDLSWEGGNGQFAMEF